MLFELRLIRRFADSSHILASVLLDDENFSLGSLVIVAFTHHFWRGKLIFSFWTGNTCQVFNAGIALGENRFFNSNYLLDSS